MYTGLLVLSLSPICVALYSGNILQSDHRVYTLTTCHSYIIKTCYRGNISHARKLVAQYIWGYTAIWPTLHQVIEMTSEVLSPNGKHGSISVPSSVPRMPENVWLCKDPVSLHLQIHILKVRCCIENMGDNGITINYGNISLTQF